MTFGRLQHIAERRERQHVEIFAERARDGAEGARIVMIALDARIGDGVLDAMEEQRRRAAEGARQSRRYPARQIAQNSACSAHVSLLAAHITRAASPRGYRGAHIAA